jgi:hypothetical protein
MKNIFQLAKLARRIPRRLRKAIKEMQRCVESDKPAAFRRVTALESQQRIIQMVATSRATMRPFRDATPHKKRKLQPAPGDMQEPRIPMVPAKEAA